jgi:hypothetical protein
VQLFARNQLALRREGIPALDVAVVGLCILFYNINLSSCSRKCNDGQQNDKLQSCYLENELQFANKLKLIRVLFFVVERERLGDVPCQPEAASLAEIVQFSINLETQLGIARRLMMINLQAAAAASSS